MSSERTSEARRAMAVLEVVDLWVHYGRIAALQGISLDVGKNQIIGVVGPNGAGKSTLLLAIAGAVRCSSGDVRFAGHSIVDERPERIVRRGIALVPEGRRIFGTLTVQENLQLGATILKPSETREQTERVLELFPALVDLRNTPASRLSGGEQQQLAIARALLARPKVLLLDEPSLGLAPIVIDRLFAALTELQQAGTTIVLVEQNVRRTVDLADRTYVLRSGTLDFSGSREELLHDERFEEAYLGVAEPGAR